MIPIPIEHIGAIISAVYKNSEPVGMGFLHYRNGSIPNEIYEKLINHFEEMFNSDGLNYYENFTHIMTMDYVVGRCCKMYFFKKKGDEANFYIKNKWMDHTPEQLIELLQDVGIILKVK